MQLGKLIAWDCTFRRLTYNCYFIFSSVYSPYFPSCLIILVPNILLAFCSLPFQNYFFLILVSSSLWILVCYSWWHAFIVFLFLFTESCFLLFFILYMLVCYVFLSLSQNHYWYKWKCIYRNGISRTWKDSRSILKKKLCKSYMENLTCMQKKKMQVVWHV